MSVATADRLTEVVGSAGLARAVGEWVAALDVDAIPADVLADVELSLDFNLGIARAGRTHLDGLAASYVAAGGGPAEATIWGDDLGPAERVAFANAMALHARAQDDFQHSAHCHIGAVVMPAVLALAEARAATGPEAIVAIAAGYQVASVLGSPFAWRTSARGLRGTLLYGPLGGAVACARILGAAPAEIASALELAANMATGFNHAWTEGTPEWRLQVGNAAETSVRCARLAALGAEAGPTTLEARYGFFAVHAGEPADATELAAALPRWRMDDIQIKPRPICGINQGPAATAADIAASERLDPRAIASIRLRMRPEDTAYPGILGTGPFNGPGTALMSTAFVVATALAKGEVGFADLEVPHDGDVLELAAKVRIEDDDRLAELGHVLSVVDAEGNEHVREYPGPDGSGDLTRESVDATLARVAAEVGDPGVACVDRRAAIEALARGGDVGAVVETL